MTPAQRRALATIMGSRVSANAGLTPTSDPFADQRTGTNPAKDKFVPHLTERTAVARGLEERRKQHGLLTPAQRKAEARATEPAAKAPTFHEKHDLTKTPLGDLTPPPVPHMTLQQITDMLGAGPRGLRGALAPGETLPTAPAPEKPLPPGYLGNPLTRRAPEEHLTGLYGVLHSAFDPLARDWNRVRGYTPAPTIERLGKAGAGHFGRDVLDPLYRFADTGLATAEYAGGVAGSEAFNPGALRIKGGQGGLSAADNPASKIHPVSSLALASRIQMGGMKRPDINIRLSDITGLVGGTPADAAGLRRTEIPFSELAGQAGWGYTDAARKAGVKRALAQGWTQAQVEAMGGDPTTFTMMQYNKPPSLLEQIGRGALSDFVQGGSQTVGLLGAASQLAQGHGEDVARQYRDLLEQTLPVVGKHNIRDEFVAHPLFTTTAALGAAKGAGAIGHFLPERERNVSLRGQVDPVTGGQAVLPLGHYDRNLYTQFGQGLVDLARTTNKRVAKHTWKSVADIYTRQQRARITPEFVRVQAAFKVAARNVPVLRQQMLLAIQDYGGATAIRRAVAHFQHLRDEGHDVPQMRLELEHLIPILENLTPEDRAFMEAHRLLAEHTSTSMQNRGAHSADSQLYRKYETPIEMGAAQEAHDGVVGPYTRAKEAREEFLHINDHDVPSERWLGRQAELLRNIKGHAMRAATPSARKVKAYQKALADYREAYKPWRAKQQEIKAREPEAPPKKTREKPSPPPSTTTTKVSENTRTKNFPTRDEALKAAKPVKEKHPDWEVKVSRGEGATWDVTVTRPAQGEPAPLKGQAKAAATRAAKKAAAQAEKVAAEHAAWKQELEAHNATRPVKPEPPAGLSRNAGRLAVHEGEVVREGKRAAHFEAQRPPEKPPEEQILQEYHDAVHAAVAAHHAEEGAIEPVRVARSQQVLKRGAHYGGSNRLTSNINGPTVHATRGVHATSGHYLYDPTMPLRESFAEQMTRMKTGLYNSLVGHPLVHDATGGGPRAVARLKRDAALEGRELTDEEIAQAAKPVFVPDGYVAVPIHYPGSGARVIEPHWGEDTSILGSDHPDPNRAKPPWERAYDELTGKTLPPNSRIKDGERVLLIPEGLHKRLQEHAKPNDVDSTYDRINHTYQKILIGAFPSTWLGNGPGSIPLAIASGAIHPRDYFRAFMTGPQGRVSRFLGIERTNSGNAAIQNTGVAGGLGRISYSNPLMAPFEAGRDLSIRGENFSARAAWEGRARVAVDGRIPTLRKIIPGLDAIMPEQLKGLAAQMSVDAATLHTWLRENQRDGKPLPPELQHVQDRLTQDVMDFMSEGAKPHGKLGRSIGKVLLFQNWIGHIVKLSLFTLPVKHPLRASLLNALSMYGNQYRLEHGAYPDWMLQFLPFLRRGNWVYSAGLGQLTPISSGASLGTAGESILQGGSLRNTVAAQAGSLASPLLQPGIAAAVQQINNLGNPEGSPDYSPLGAAKAAAFYAIPGAHKIGPTNGFTPDSVNFLGGSVPGFPLEKKHYYMYILQGRGQHKRVEIPWEARGAQPLGGLLGLASRYFGVPVEKSAVAGLPFNVQRMNDLQFNYNAQYKRNHPTRASLIAKAKAKQHHG